MIFWFLGQPCSGKTTLINETLKVINPKKNIPHAIIDNDQIRSIYKDKDYSRAGRERNLQRAMDIALYENSKNKMVFAGFVTPFNFQRLWLQEQVGQENIGFIYLHYNPKYDERGRENYHFQDFEAPQGLVNYIRLDTGLIPQPKCVHHICKFLVKMINQK
jgi:adenylylsulfate kinase-like enzyme